MNFQSRPESGSAADRLIEGLQQELFTMQTWHAQACGPATPSTPGLSGRSVMQIKELFADFINGRIETQTIGDQEVSDLLRFASEDLKAFYFMAVSTQPGQSTDPKVLADWFWGKTCAAACINEVRKACLKREAGDMQLTGKLLLIPRNQLHHFKE